MSSDIFPKLPYDKWKETKKTLHLFTQIVGKIKLAINPKMNHWWHVPLYISARGLTTSTMPYQGGNIEMEFDFIDHKLIVRDSGGGIKEIALQNISVAEFYASLMNLLKSYGMELNLLPVPFDPAKTGSDIPYDEDNEHSIYDSDYVSRFFKVLTLIEPVFKLFRGKFLGKCSPLHFFWHSFDLALTRFSGKAVEV
ncbi:MAG: hypothetical protein GF310_04605, partial [candidate division Zixibacteria bacterium]|nr:hypothetical protein [candidate division Zixibacteria bacterium]